MRRLAVAGVAAVWLSVLWGAPPTPLPAAAAGMGVGGQATVEHRAAIVIDTGTEVKSVCVRFREESISGVEALARAQVDPVFHGFAGKGAAVCALCGVGCPAGDSCLTCNREGKFWSYSRAPAGTTSLRTSGVGASSTTVRDGDVEGWKWALGGAPPFQTVEQVCGEPPAPTTSMPATTAVTAAAAGTVTTAGRTGTPASTPAPARPGAATTAPTAAPPGSSAAPDDGATATPSPDATAPPTTEATGPSPGLAASRDQSGNQGGGNGPELALFAVLLAGLLVWGARARRARTRQTD